MDSQGAAPVTAGKAAWAAAALLAKLGLEQRSRASYDFEADERQDWHYVPMARVGVPRGEMSVAQLEAADALMASGLSEEGYGKAVAIIGHELILGRAEAGDGVTRFDRDPGLYYYCVFGSPGDEGPWGWRVEGHHLSLNFSLVDGETVAPTPSFFGANPAEVESGPDKGLRILREEEDLARELFVDLDPGQRELALIYPVTPPDIITRASPRVDIDARVGLPAAQMTGDQRRALMSLIQVYVGRKPDDIARIALRKLEAEGIDEIHFGWAGSPHRGQPHYYRVHGRSLFVEYDNTQNMANHIHSVWRDVEGDFGFDALRAHYRRHHA